MQLNEFRNGLHNREFDEAKVYVVGKDGVVVPVEDYMNILYIVQPDGTKVVHVSAIPGA